MTKRFGLKVSETGFRGDLASGLLLLAMVGIPIVVVFLVLEGQRGHPLGLELALLAAALAAGVGGGALTHNWTDALRSVLNGALISATYLTVYFADALIETPAARHDRTVLWAGLSVAGLVAAMKALERLPPPPGSDEAP
jgi:hypothetical protein